MKTRIGYFIPEFPAQTHIFFWRERQALKELGIETCLISTRLPQKGISPHIWSSEARQETTYLVPFTAKDILQSCITLLKAGPGRWIRCLSILFKTDDTSFSHKIRLLAFIFVAAKLVELAKTQGWFHIHVHSCGNAANVAMFASTLSSLTYSLTLHGPALEVYGPDQQQKWQYAEFGLVVSETLHQDLKKKLTDSLPKTVAVAPMGVNLSHLKRRSPYIPWSSGPCVLFSCGRLNPIKGHNYLISAIEILRSRGYDIRLKIAGEDEKGGLGYRQFLSGLIAEKSLTNHVELLGAVPESDIHNLLEEANIFVLASLNEGIPVAVMEAMAMEVPVVATNVGGVYELIDDGNDGLLVSPKEPKILANTIEKLLKNETLAIKLSQRSRKKISEKFHDRRSAEALAACLRIHLQKDV